MDWSPLREHGSLCWPVRVDPLGREGPTRAQARGPRWRRTSSGRFVPAGIDGTAVEQRIVEAGAVLPSYGGVTGWAALRWLGGAWFGGNEPDGLTPRDVWLATSCSDIRSQPGIRVSAEGLPPDEVIETDGLRTTTALRSVLFEMRYAPTLRRAVAALDMAAYSDLVSLGEMATYVEAHNGWTGIIQAREALAIADENAWSPQEVLARLIWTLDAELPRPRTNVPVFDRSGRLLGTPDLLDEEAGVIVEYDGAMHLAGQRRRSDRHREERFRDVGLEYVVLMSGDVSDRVGTAERMEAARRRARFAAESARLWTTRPPAWWVDTTTVERRRALTAYERERLLRYRIDVG